MFSMIKCLSMRGLITIIIWGKKLILTIMVSIGVFTYHLICNKMIQIWRLKCDQVRENEKFNIFHVWIYYSSDSDPWRLTYKIMGMGRMEHGKTSKKFNNKKRLKYMGWLKEKKNKRKGGLWHIYVEWYITNKSLE